MERRKFIEAIFKGACALSLLPYAKRAFTSGKEPAKPVLSSQKLFEARHYQKLAGKKVKCVLCPRECMVSDSKRGHCDVRENRGGTYYSLVYGRPCSIGLDPIEKKPLFHFRPGTLAFSLATAGCNFDCKFCQNWNISQVKPEDVQSIALPPLEVVREAKKNNAKSIAFTYSEPVVFQEYMIDTAIEGKKQGIPVVMITNGFIKSKPLEEVCKNLPAIKVDFKGFSEKFYRETCDGRLKPVLDSLMQIKKSGTWLELVVLLIPGYNDSVSEIDKMTKWIVSNLGKDVPLHFSRFNPMYKMINVPSTPTDTLVRSRMIAMKNGINFVYIGNVPGHEGEHTYCPKCKKRIIERYGFVTKVTGLKNGLCSYCGQKIPGVWS